MRIVIVTNRFRLAIRGVIALKSSNGYIAPARNISGKKNETPYKIKPIGIMIPASTRSCGEENIVLEIAKIKYPTSKVISAVEAGNGKLNKMKNNTAIPTNRGAIPTINPRKGSFRSYATCPSFIDL
jgi:hypothetical protein